MIERLKNGDAVYIYICGTVGNTQKCVLENEAVISSITPDPNPTNNADIEMTPINHPCKPDGILQPEYPQSSEYPQILDCSRISEEEPEKIQPSEVPPNPQRPAREYNRYFKFLFGPFR
jgi:hypothetical protein